MTVHPIFKKPSLEDILAIQASQARVWKSSLKEEFAQLLDAKIAEENAKLTPESDPYDVWRGNLMDQFIYHLKKQPHFYDSFKSSTPSQD